MNEPVSHMLIRSESYTQGFRCDFDAPREAFQVLMLADVSAIAWGGLVRYSPEFHSLP